MNLQQMKEARQSMDRAASNSAYYRAQKKAHDKIVDRNIRATYSTSEEERLSREIDALMREVA